MKYFEVTFTLTPCTQDAQDILSALAAEAGFETFEEIDGRLVGYVQQQLFDAAVLDAVLDGFPFENTQIKYNVREAEDRDWNAEWEQEGFEPIIVSGGPLPSPTIIIHDGRHLPDDTIPSPLTSDPSPLTIEIDAHMAFGTGTHETTRMMCARLLSLDLHGKNILDCGSGTGILGICALKLGAAHCLAYDIDEWSADNTRHNAVINRVDERITVLHGDATLLGDIAAEHSVNVPADSPADFHEGFHIVMANINRNILLNDMERFVSVMAPKATLLLSGFYENDCAMLESKAQSLGLVLSGKFTDSEWACLTFSRL